MVMVRMMSDFDNVVGGDGGIGDNADDHSHDDDDDHGGGGAVAAGDGDVVGADAPHSGATHSRATRARARSPRATCTRAARALSPRSRQPRCPPCRVADWATPAVAAHTSSPRRPTCAGHAPRRVRRSWLLPRWHWSPTLAGATTTTCLASSRTHRTARSARRTVSWRAATIRIATRAMRPRRRNSRRSQKARHRVGAAARVCGALPTHRRRRSVRSAQ